MFSGKHYTRKGFDPKATGLDSLQWDSAELLQIGVQDQMSYDDAFTIEQVWLNGCIVMLEFIFAHRLTKI